MIYLDSNVLAQLCIEAEQEQYNRTLAVDLLDELVDPSLPVGLEPEGIIHLHYEGETEPSHDWVVRCAVMATFKGDRLPDRVGVLDVNSDTYRALAEHA